LDKQKLIPSEKLETQSLSVPAPYPENVSWECNDVRVKPL